MSASNETIRFCRDELIDFERRLMSAQERGVLQKGLSNGRTPINRFVQIGLGTLERPSGHIAADAEHLVHQCLKQIKLEDFPPKLFIVWATSAFKPYDGLLREIGEQLRKRNLSEVPIIGSSVAVCLFEQGPHEQGAMLICLASPFITARAAIGLNAQLDPSKGASKFIRRLGFGSNQPPNPRDNRFLIVFIPGYGENPANGTVDLTQYKAAEIVEQLRAKTRGRLNMFGGVSSAGVLERGIGHQFLGKRVCKNSVVGALVETKLSHGIGLNHGLVPTNQSYHVKHLKRDQRTITDFEEGSPAQVMAEVGQACLFGVRNELGGQIIVKPQLVNEGWNGAQQPTVKLLRDILNSKNDKRIKIEVLRPDLMRIIESVQEHEALIKDRFRLDTHIAAILTVGCISRYNHREAIGFELKAALRHRQERFPGCLLAGCYMDGEIGVDRLGRSDLANWSLAELFIGDGFNAKAGLFDGFDALTQWTQPATTAPSLEAAMEQCLECVRKAGWSGAMISLVLEDGEKRWIIGAQALGEKWKTQVLRRTAREYSGDDILAIVARNRKAEFVRDALEDKRCSKEAARLGNVISFYTIPLLNERQKTVGVLQIDLGDMREFKDLPREEKAVLDSIGAMTGAAINRAIQHEELSLIRQFDKLLPKCAVKNSLEEAVSFFVKGAAEAMEADVHIRLYDQNKNTLRLIDGTGRYYEAIKRVRREISSHNRHSPAALSFQTGKRNVANDLTRDRLMKRAEGIIRVKKALQQVKAYANCPLKQRGQRPIGVVSIGTTKKTWFFTQSRLRTLDDISQRLAILLAHVKQKQQKDQAFGKLRFLTDTSPPLHKGLNLLSALRSQLEKIRAAATPDPDSDGVVASCYLYDEAQDCLVLRAEVGWRDKGWLNAAWYNLPKRGRRRAIEAVPLEARGSKRARESRRRRGVGLIGRLAARGTPLWIENVTAYKRGRHIRNERDGSYAGKYERAMFGRKLPWRLTTELIALPLSFRDEPLGIVTLHRKRPLPVPQGSTGFAMVDRKLLGEAGRILSAFISGLVRHEHTQWQEKDRQRSKAVAQDLKKGKEKQ